MDDFYRHLFAGAPHSARVSVWSKRDKLTEHIPVGDFAAYRAHCDRYSPTGDVYVGIATRLAGLSPKARGKVEHCASVAAFFLDVDRRSDAAHVAQNLPATDADLASILSVCPHEPTMIVDSGHGWHVYWCFPHEENIGTDLFSSVSKSWQEQFINHAKSLGWHLDQTGNIDRVLRVPGTLNHKIPTDPRPVILLAADGPIYTLDQLTSEATPPPVVLPAPPAGSGIFANPPAVEPSGAKAAGVPAGGAAPIPATPPRAPTGRDDATILADLRRGMASVKSAQTKALMAKILAGESFATPGKRDTELNRAAGTVGFLEPNEDPAVLARVFDDSLRHWDKEDSGKYTQADRLKWAADKIKRAQDKKRSTLAQERETNSGIERALCAAARRAPRGANLPPPPDDPTAAYSETELNAFAAQQGASSPDAFKKRWIIQKGTAYYVYVNGAYKAPLTREELAVAVYADLAPADGSALSLSTLDSKGNRRRKTLPEILGDYSTVARGFISQVGLDCSHYDGLEDTFYESVAPLRGTVHAKFHPQIDHWLRQLGGTKADKLLDWIASVTRLDKQACALFLFGAPGTGKTMLATGLARLWTTGGPTELGRVLGEWSSDLARCPLVFADEQIPNAGPRSRTSADLRSLIGSSARTLTRKYMPNTDMIGCIRLLLASNNFEMLMFDETLSQHDLEAVAGRFMFIEADESARTYLENTDTEGWVSADMIAEHALWLRANRVVTPGKRFLVEGEESVLTSMLALQGNTPNMVAEWISRALADTGKKTGAVTRGFVKIHDGNFLVSTNALVDFWELYVKNQRQPHTYAIGSALRNLSTRQVRLGGRRYWSVNLDTLIPWADAHQIEDADVLWAHVQASEADAAAPPAPAEPDADDQTQE